MPIFEYACKVCGQQFEFLLLPSTVPECPECHGRDLERLISVPTVKSGATHDMAMRAARKRDAKQAKKNTIEQRIYEKEHRH